MALLDEIQFQVYGSYVKIPLIFFVPALTILTVYAMAYFLANSPPTWRALEATLHEQLGGEFDVEYLRVGWTLNHVEVYDASLKTPDGEEVIRADFASARLSLLALLTNRVDFDRGRVRGGAVHLRFDDQGRLNLLRVFGRYDQPPDPDREPGDREWALGFADLATEDVDFSFTTRDFTIDIPGVTIPRGSVFIEPNALLMSVDTLALPEANFRFGHHLFGFPADRGDWTFTVRDFTLDNWQWANAGFVVERFGGDVEGVLLEASGRMGFPMGDEFDTMTYEARADLSAEYSSPLVEYFTGGVIRFDVPRLQAAFAGDLDQIHGVAQVDGALVNGNGLIFEDLTGPVEMHNRFFLADGLTGHAYGGDFVAHNAFFSIVDQIFGAELHLEGLNPRSFVQDVVGQDQPFIDGSMAGAVSITGRFPGGTSPRPDHRYSLIHNVNTRFIELEVLQPVTLARQNDLLFPNPHLTLRPGTQFWIDQRRLGLPRATISSGPDRFTVQDFFLETRTQHFEFPEGRRPVRFTAEIDQIAPYATYYDLHGLEGPARFAMTMEGYFGSPAWTLEGQMLEPSFRLADDTVLSGTSLDLLLSSDDGIIDIELARLVSTFGDIDVSGQAHWFEPAPPRDAPQPWPVWEYRERQPLSLDIDARDVALEVFSPLIHDELRATGYLSGRLKLGGEMGALTGDFDASARDAVVRGQTVEEGEATGSFSPSGLRIDQAQVDLGPAGTFTGKGGLDYAGAMAFDLRGESVDLSQVRELDDLPFALGGRARFHMTGGGTLDDPLFTGGAQVRNISVDGREYGDVAIAADTIDSVVYLSGGLLPWVSANIELPLRGPSPFYARVGMEELAVLDFLPELRDHPMLDEVQATGMAELFFERDFSRYQSVFYLTDLEIDSRGERIRNRGPVIVGFNNGEVLTFQRATLGSRGRFFTLEGAIAYEPTLLDLQIEGDMDLALLQSIRAGFPEYFPDFFVEADGYVLLDLAVRGLLENFVAHGSIAFGPSDWELRFLPEPINIQSGQMVFGDHGIHIPEHRPIQGTLLGGPTRISGDIGYLADQPRTLDLSMWSHNMSYRWPDLVDLAFDTDLRIQASDWAEWDTWLIGGHMDILDGLYTQRIQLMEQAVTGRVMGALGARRTDRYEAGLFELVPILEDIQFDLNVRARDGFRLLSSVDRLEMDLEFRFDLRLRDTLVNPRVAGDVDVIGGQVGFQGETFEVRSGSVRFDDDLANPYLDIVAGADVRNTCRESDFLDDVSPTMTLSTNLDATGLTYYHIIMNIRGELSNLDLHMESNPYADQRDILSLLLTGCTVDELTASSASRPTLEIALGPLLGRLEREIQDVVAVEEFTILPGVERTQVRIGDTLTRRLSWRFQLDTGFTDSTGGQQYQLQYRLSDHWSAELSERSQTETNNFLIDLKLQYRLPLD